MGAARCHAPEAGHGPPNSRPVPVQHAPPARPCYAPFGEAAASRLSVRRREIINTRTEMGRRNVHGSAPNAAVVFLGGCCALSLSCRCDEVMIGGGPGNVRLSGRIVGREAGGDERSMRGDYPHCMETIRGEKLAIRIALDSLPASRPSFTNPAYHLPHACLACLRWTGCLLLTNAKTG